MTDQESNMAGINNGLGALIKEDVPNLIRCHDLCHIYNLVLQPAIKSYPESVLNIVRNICSYFNMSTVMMGRLMKIQT